MTGGSHELPDECGGWWIRAQRYHTCILVASLLTPLFSSGGSRSLFLTVPTSWIANQKWLGILQDVDQVC